MNGYIEEMMAGQKVVKAFNHEEESMKAFDVLNIEFCSAATKANTYANIMGPIMNNLSHIFYSITTTLGVLGLVTSGSVLIAFLQYIRQFAGAHIADFAAVQFRSACACGRGARV